MMAANENSLIRNEYTKAQMTVSEEGVNGKCSATEEIRTLFPVGFSPMSISMCNGWEMLPAFDGEEIGHETRNDVLKPVKKPKVMSCVETAKSQIISRALPEELEEKIVASIPYPYILEVRMMSKAWNRRLSATSNENAGFREMVKSTSYKWPSYFPLIFNRSKGFLVGFNRNNRSWMRIFLGSSDLEGRPREVNSKQAPWKLALKVGGGGSLMCCMGADLRVFVINVFTGAWKWLPDRPRMDGSICSWMYMFLDGPDRYKVLTMTTLSRRHDGCEICTQLYESKSNSWSMKLSTVNSSPVDVSGVYLNGVVYFTQYNIGNGLLEVWAYNVQKGAWHSIPHPLLLMMHTFRTFKLMLCQDQLILVVRLKRASPYDDGLEKPRIRRNSLILYKLDPLTEKFSEVYRGPHMSVVGASASLYVSEGDCIYFGKLRKESSFLMEFNIRSRNWASFPSSLSVDPFANLMFSSFAFQPGKNPFIVV